MIRKAKPEDASRIAEIKIFGWRTAYRGIIDERVLFGELNIESKAIDIRESIKNNEKEYLVFEDKNIIKSMMIIGKSRDSDKPESFELYCLYVEPLMLNNGIGTQMLSYCEKEAQYRGYKENVLWVLKKNIKGRVFYEKNRYKEDGKEQEIKSLGVEEIRYHKVFDE